MACFSADVKKLFEDNGQAKLCGDLEGLQAKLVERRVDHVEYGDPEKLTPKALARANFELLRHALLHRAERLLVSTGTALLDKNAYSLALLARGQVETTAVLAYFCYRVRAYSRANLIFDELAKDVADTVAGGKHDMFAGGGSPKNILTMIEKADKFIDQEIMKDQEPKGVLKEGYSWLSEFAHPNFLSHSCAFKLNTDTHRMVFRNQAELQKEDFQHLVFLSLSCEIFLQVFDELGKQVAEKLKD